MGELGVEVKRMSTTIDLNCDMGESFGSYALGQDAEMMKWISSANIACGFHAGDPRIMRRTVRLCLEHGVSIGAHPGLPDLQGFGRRTMALSPDEVYEIMLYQIGALQGFLRAEGAELAHVKPHGALYHMAEADASVAEQIAKAVAAAAPEAALVALSQGVLARSGEAAGLRVKHEAFADRKYQRDGRLVPRTESGAVLDANTAAAQAVSLALHGSVNAADGTVIPLRADTICIHGDSPNALQIAETIYTALRQEGICIQA